MRSTLRTPARALLTALMMSSLAAPAAAHGDLHGIVDRPTTLGGVGVEFLFTSGEPVADTPFRVLPPGEDVAAFQSGRTDRLGRATFLPDRPGAWRIVLDDGRDHRATATLEVGPDRVLPAEPVWRRWLLRGSLLLDFVLIAALAHVWWSRRRAPAHGQLHDPAHEHAHPHPHRHHGHAH